jgi:hypothetical protein
MMIMPITDKTSWQLSRQGALQSFETTSLFLPTPEPKTVLEQRIKYLESKVSDKNEEKGRGYFLSYGIKLDLDHLKAFTHCLQHVFLETGKASMWVGHLSNMDIRRSLVLTRDIMASPYIKVEELLKAYIAQTAQVSRTRYSAGNNPPQLQFLSGQQQPVRAEHFLTPHGDRHLAVARSPHSDRAA